MNRKPSLPFIGVEPFDASYGAAFRADEEDEHTVECRVVEDGGHLRIRRPRNAGPPARLCFVDGVRQTEAHLTRTTSDGEIVNGIAGAWGAGAVLIGADGPASIAQVEVGRAVIFAGGHQVHLPAHPGGWRWLSLSVEAEEPRKVSGHLQRLMRDTEARIADRPPRGRVAHPAGRAVTRHTPKPHDARGRVRQDPPSAHARARALEDGTTLGRGRADEPVRDEGRPVRVLHPGG